MLCSHQGPQGAEDLPALPTPGAPSPCPLPRMPCQLPGALSSCPSDTAALLLTALPCPATGPTEPGPPTDPCPGLASARPCPHSLPSILGLILTLPTGWCPSPTLACPQGDSLMPRAGAALVSPGRLGPVWGGGAGPGCQALLGCPGETPMLPAARPPGSSWPSWCPYSIYLYLIKFEQTITSRRISSPAHTSVGFMGAESHLCYSILALWKST